MHTNFGSIFFLSKNVRDGLSFIYSEFTIRDDNEIVFLYSWMGGDRETYEGGEGGGHNATFYASTQKRDVLRWFVGG